MTDKVVWVVRDLDDLVAVAASEGRARRAAEDHVSVEIDRGFMMVGNVMATGSFLARGWRDWP